MDSQGGRTDCVVAIFHQLRKFHLMVVHQDWVGDNNEGHLICQGLENGSCPGMADDKACFCDISSKVWEVIFHPGSRIRGAWHRFLGHSLAMRCRGTRLKLKSISQGSGGAHRTVIWGTGLGLMFLILYAPLPCCTSTSVKPCCCKHFRRLALSMPFISASNLVVPTVISTSFRWEVIRKQMLPQSC